MPQTLPRVVVQLLLPESVQQLQRTITALSSPPSSSRLHPAPSESFSSQYSFSMSSRMLRHSMSRSSNGRQRLGSAGAAAGGASGRAWHVADSSKAALHKLMAPAGAVTAAATNMATVVTSTMAGAVQQVLQLGPDITPSMLVGCPFWSAFQTCLEPVCVQEVEQALMCHSALGVPGVVTLLHNLVVTRDVSLPLPEAMKLARDASSSKNAKTQQAEVGHCRCCVRLALLVLLHHCQRDGPRHNCTCAPPRHIPASAPCCCGIRPAGSPQACIMSCPPGVRLKYFAQVQEVLAEA